MGKTPRRGSSGGFDQNFTSIDQRPNRNLNKRFPTLEINAKRMIPGKMYQLPPVEESKVI